VRSDLRVKGRDIPVRGDGLIDFGRDIESGQLSVNGRQVEHLQAGRDSFHRLSENRQRLTGKLWLREPGCPYGEHWIQVFAAVRHIAPPSVAKLHAHLRVHGRDRLTLDVWLADDMTVRRMRQHGTGLELALLDGRTRVVTETTDYWDFGVTADLAAPPADQVLGDPDDYSTLGSA
jgi:hypothetical protein